MQNLRLLSFYAPSRCPPGQYPALAGRPDKPVPPATSERMARSSDAYGSRFKIEGYTQNGGKDAASGAASRLLLTSVVVCK